uniref:HDC16607 n=1 Tax=Drosophila melanogaster TaxID=7227 RepID=Q6IIX8_DROME|nr:TPA_inf: HDC16607 [Drosophila melanogaster]
MVPHPHPSPPATPPGTEHKACSLSGISGPLYFGIYQRQRKQIAEKEKLEEASVTRRDGDGVRWERGSRGLVDRGSFKEWVQKAIACTHEISSTCRKGSGTGRIKSRKQGARSRVAGMAVMAGIAGSTLPRRGRAALVQLVRHRVQGTWTETGTGPGGTGRDGVEFGVGAQTSRIAVRVSRVYPLSNAAKGDLDEVIYSLALLSPRAKQGPLVYPSPLWFCWHVVWSYRTLPPSCTSAAAPAAAALPTAVSQAARSRAAKQNHPSIHTSHPAIRPFIHLCSHSHGYPQLEGSRVCRVE